MLCKSHTYDFRACQKQVQIPWGSTEPGKDPDDLSRVFRCSEHSKGLRLRAQGDSKMRFHVTGP